MNPILCSVCKKSPLIDKDVFCATIGCPNTLPINGVKRWNMIQKMFSWSVYLAECSDGTLYCGISNNVKKRIEIHNKGKGSKYTRTRLPVSLVYSEEIGDKGDAMRRELQIKKMSRKEKLDLIDFFTV